MEPKEPKIQTRMRTQSNEYRYLNVRKLAS